MNKIVRTCILAIALVVLSTSVSGNELEKLIEDDRYTIVVFYRTADEPRAFTFNLNLSTAWNRIEARNINTLDVGPGQYNLDNLSAQFGIGNAEFAVLVIAPGGEILHRTEDPDSLDHILAIIDQEQHRDNDPLTSEDP